MNMLWPPNFLNLTRSKKHIENIIAVQKFRVMSRKTVNSIYGTSSIETNRRVVQTMEMTFMKVWGQK